MTKKRDELRKHEPYEARFVVRGIVQENLPIKTPFPVPKTERVNLFLIKLVNEGLHATETDVSSAFLYTRKDTVLCLELRDSDPQAGNGN